MASGLGKKTFFALGLVVTAYGLILWSMEEVFPLGTPNTALLVLAISSIVLIIPAMIFLPRHFNFRPSVNRTLLVYALGLLLYPLVLGLNVKFDDSLMLHVRLPVIEKFPSALKGETYVVTFFLPYTRVNANGIQSAELKRFEYDRVDPTDTYIHLELREGAFGIPWVQSYWLEYPPKRKAKQP